MDQNFTGYFGSPFCPDSSSSEYYTLPSSGFKETLRFHIFFTIFTPVRSFFSPFHPVIDTTIRDALRKVLQQIGVPLIGHGFHAFRRSGATLAFDNNVQLQQIMAHGLWRSSAVWTYLQNASLAPSIPPPSLPSSLLDFSWVWALNLQNNLKNLKVLTPLLCLYLLLMCK